MSSLTWMAAMISKDEEEKFDQLLSFTEYLASFINPDAVQEVRNVRNNRVSAGGDSEFKKVIEKLSGRPAPTFQGND